MAEKRTSLEIVISAVDKATAGIRAIKQRIDAIAVLAAPIGLIGERLGGLANEAGLPRLVDGFKGVGGAIATVLGRVAMIGGVVGGAVAGLMSLVDGFDDLGDKAEAAGVGVDFLAQMRYAAERSGAAAEKLDTGLINLSKSMGEMRANKGPLVEFLKIVSPALLQQLKATKGNEEAFGLLADAMVKLKDPAKRAAFAQKALGDASLAPLLAKGAAGIKELRDRYLDLAGSQEGAAGEAGKVDDSLKDLKAATDGIKAALVQGLAPALGIVVEQLRDWFKENRARIGEFAASLGKKLPGAVSALVGIFKDIVDAVRPFVDSATKLKVIAIALAAVIVGPLISAVVSLGAAILATPIGWFMAAIALLAGAVYLVIENWDDIVEFFSNLWTAIKRMFGAAWDAISSGVIAGLSAAGAAIVAAWDGVKGAFAAIWDGIVGVFQKAWKIIKDIVDKVTGAVDTVTGAIGDAIDFINPFSDDGPEWNPIAATMGRPGELKPFDLTQQATAARATLQQATEAKVTVDFANAPRGTRVQADPQSTASVDLSVGYQMIPGSL
ncbi:MAG TPA: hypothetical protein VFO62_10350 [Candidatus Binatia bacterium]|nr:hypothetical protein [Candidatus Binatia bacterium]